MSTTPYPAGQGIRLGPVQLVDDQGNPVDPATLILTVKLPDGSTATFDIGQLHRLGIGHYQYIYTPLTGGHYAYSFVATGPDAAVEGEFTVSPSLMDSDAGQVFGWPGAYLTIPEFKAMPTGVNIDDLIANGSAASNDAELANILARASRWADNRCTIRLGAHAVLAERQSVRAARDGTIMLAPKHTSGNVPAIRLTRFAYGTPGQMVDATPAAAATWTGEDGLIILPFGGAGGSTPLQFGGPPPGGRMWVEYDYFAGFPITTLTDGSLATDTTLAAQDATGVEPGQALTVHDPGAEETVTVAGSWTPTTGPAAIPLSAGAAFDHPPGTGIGAMPMDIKLAVGQIAIVYIRRASDTGAPAMDKAVGVDMEALEASASEILDRYTRIGAN